MAFILGDIALFYVALFLALVERQGHVITNQTWEAHWPAFTIVLLLWLIVFYINDLYSSRTAKKGPILLNRILFSMLINALLGAVFFYITIRFWSIKPQTILLLTVINYGVMVYIWRQAIVSFLGSQNFKNVVVFIGYNKTVDELIKFIQDEPELGYTVNAIIDGVSEVANEIPRYELSEHTLQTVLYNHRIDTIVLSSEQYKNPEVVSALYKLISPSIAILSLPAFYEEITGKIPLSQIEHAWALEHLTSRLNSLFTATKRLIDITSVIVLGGITLLLLPFIALAILIDSGLPIFFTQTRVGLKGKEFKAIKFRTMIQNAEKDGAQWSQKNDPRITRIGRFMRKTRLDELPQLWNVLKGELSLVGPRPERPEFVQQLIKEIPFYKERLLVQPGLTGWAQVVGPSYGGSKEESLEKLQYDLYYIKNRSLGLELAVMLKTIKTILAFRGQ